MNVSSWSIHRPLPAILLFVMLCLAGLFGFDRLAISRFPDIAFPMVAVTVTLPGATPGQLETEVTRKVEDSVASLRDVKRIVSSVNEGVSTTLIEFRLERELNEALDDVRDSVTRIRSDLPVEIEEPIVQKIEITGGSMLTYTVASDSLGVEELSWFVDNDVTRALYGVRGVGSVKRLGGLDREIRVDLKPESLLAYGVTAGEVSGQLARIQVERPGGRANWTGSEQAIRTVGTVKDAEALRAFPIALADGRQVRLGELAEVRDGAAELSQLSLYNGKPAVGFEISRTRGASEVDVATDIRARLAELGVEHPRIRIEQVASTVEEAEGSYESSMTMLIEGSLLAVLVVLWFLKDWRATWISAIALPLSIIPTFLVMWLFGFSLNLITLLALAVVVGILVDDAIVEVENIDRHLAMGKSPKQAAIDAADEIGLAVIATSMTLAAVFIPVAFMPGIPGKFFREFGWTAATAVLFSLAVARMLTPMMAAHQLKAKPHNDEDSALMKRYLSWVDWALRHRALTLWAALALFILSLMIVPFIPSTFIPPGDLGRSNLSLELPPGTPIEDTAAVAEEARAALSKVPELASVFTIIGGVIDIGDPAKTGIGEVRKATLILNWTPATERDRGQKELETDVRQKLQHLAGVRVSFISTEPGELMQLVLAGDDADQLLESARALERDLRKIPGLGSISSTASLLRPEIVITPDPARAADLGVATADIAEAARIATAGDFRQRLAKLNLPERQIPIRVRLAESALSDEALIGMLRVPSKNGPVPLAAVAKIELSSGPSQIDRFARSRNVGLNAELNGRPLGDVMAEVNELPSVKNLPKGVAFLNAGDAEVFVELFYGFILAMVTGLFCVYAVLILLFNHPLHPITILLAVPLCAGGAFGAMLLTGTWLSLPALIGLLMLIGIATKNSILLVDYAVIAEHDQGMSQHEALIDACRKRARPVLMTSIAMTAGMLPIAFGFGADASFRQPMAISVIGGLATSTILSLIVIPAAYGVIDTIGQKMGIKHRRGEAVS